MKLIGCPGCHYACNEIAKYGTQGRSTHYNWTCNLCGITGSLTLRSNGTYVRHTKIKRVPENVVAAWRLGGPEAAKELLATVPQMSDTPDHD